jgi:acetyl-CoA carboxylase biotin carboxyl carrier protein
MPSNKKAAARTAKSSPELDLIRNLAEILNESGLSEIELDQKGTHVRVSRVMMSMAPAHAPMHHVPASTLAAQQVAGAAKMPEAEHPGTVKSPMVGTVYLAPSPGAPNFVDVGTEVKEGQTLLIIEAMKTMNQIQAPRAGKVTHVLVDNAQPVEFGEALVVIE